MKEALATTQKKAKHRHDKHRTPLSFQLGDHVWLLLDKHRFKGPHHKLHPLRYGPYVILEKIGENAYHLDLPTQLGIHNVINVNNLKLFEPPILEDAVPITHPMDIIPDFQMPVQEDTILESKQRTTRNTQYISYLVARKGQTPAQAKWMNKEMILRLFPHLLQEAGDASEPK